VVYQVFYDDDTKKYVDDYIEELKRYVRMINPNEGLKYLVWKVKVKQLIDDKEKHPFELMKSQEIYKFVKEGDELQSVCV